jgi:hypothetical protein
MEAVYFSEKPGAHLSTQIHCSVFHLTAPISFAPYDRYVRVNKNFLNLEVLPISVCVLTLGSYCK